MMDINKKSIEYRMKKNIIKTNNENECWEWIGRMNCDGYGGITYKYKEEKSHRMAWMLQIGDIPANMCVCHKCDNPSCCNPNHLFLGTHSDNMIDSLKKDRFAPAKLKIKQVLEIRQLYNNNVGINELKQKYNVSRNTIWRVVNNKTFTCV